MAQFSKGQIVDYNDGNGNVRLAVVTKVESDDPAQYHLKLTDTNEETVCGEGADKKEAGAVTAL